MSNMFLNIVSTFKGDGIRQATGELSAFSGKMGGLGSVLGKVGGALAAFGVTAKAISFGRESIEAARDLERNLYGVDKVFGSLAPQMQQFAKDADEMGLSQSKAAKASTFIGSVLKQSGFAMGDVAVETQKLIGLATDLSALYGYDVQEALLGMTALFRGEYDPIEKFGVAMKQSEINSELAARGLDHLEGAARRNAEQTIRLELLYQRSADALGTFAEQSGSLYTEQKKLGATFENFQANLGGMVIPAVAELNTLFRELLEDITPGMEGVFSFLAEVLSEVVRLFQDAMDPSTVLGESVSALAIQFESLLKTIFGQDVSIADFFDFAAFAIGAVLDGLHDLLMVVENIVIFFQVMWEAMTLFFTDLNAFFAFDQGEELKKRIDLKDRLNGNSLAVQQYLAEWDKANSLTLEGHNSQIRMTADAWERANLAQYNYAKSLSGTADSIERQMLQKFGGLPKGSQPTPPPPPPPPPPVFSGSGGSSRASREKAAAEAAAAAEKAILDKRQSAFESFNSAVKSLFSQIKESIMSSFTLPNLGNSVNSITKNIGKLLEKTKAFARNIKTLSEQGLDATLLQQVIGAGPIEGAKLAEALVGGGSGFLQELNSAFGEFGNLAGSIAGVGTERAFANQGTVNNYSIEVTGGVATSSDVGRAVVNAIKDFERQSGTAWRG
jgi:hypothetical protein